MIVAEGDSENRALWTFWRSRTMRRRGSFYGTRHIYNRR